LSGNVGQTGKVAKRVDASTPVCWLSENGGHTFGYRLKIFSILPKVIFFFQFLTDV